jgi:hypothetical protein
MNILGTSLVFLAAVTAQAGRVSAVLLDEATRSIRPIVRSGEFFVTGGASVKNFDYAALAGDARNAVAVRGGAVYIIRRLDGASPVWRELTLEEFKIGRAAWSEDSNALALLAADGSRLQLWKKLNSDPAPAGEVDLTAIEGRIVSFTLDSGAKTIFVAARDQAGGTLWLLSPNQVPRIVLTLDMPGELVLTGGALYVADRGRSEILKLTQWDTAMQVTTIAMAGHGIQDPAGFALSRDGKTLWVASRETQQVVALDIDKGAVTAVIDLAFAPTRFQPAGAGTLFFVTSGVPGAQPAVMIDTGSLDVFGVPVSASAAE